MKAEKVLERYGAGERNFRRVNLRGQSFKGKDLSGADFSYADIRGADFTKAYLKGANFSHARAGLQKHWVIVLLIASFFLSTLSGFTSAIGNIYAANFFIPKFIATYTIWPGVVLVVVFAVFFIVAIQQGLGAVAFAGVVAGGVAVGVVGGVVRDVAIADAVGAASGAAGGVAVAFASVVAGGVAVAVAGGVAGAIAIVVAVAGGAAVAGAIAGGAAVAGAIAEGAAVPGVVAGVVAVVVALLSNYFGWRALAGDEKHAFIRNIAIAFAAKGGTSFRGANLIDANFTKAVLKNTNFSKATLTRTRFYEAQKLELARVDDTILATLSVLSLLVNDNGRGKSYADAKLNLTGANLKGYDLKEANLKNANISEATFEGACLEWANLTLTQAVGTNFTSTQMTGACVEAWNIEHTTILDNVDCRFIYLLEEPLPGTDNRERRPSSGEFKPGEFTKLFQEVFDTVDLIFRNGIDWKAFVAAFKKVQVENEETELEIQSIENKGDGVVVVKVNVPSGTNKEKIHSDFTQFYELALKATEEKYKAQLKAANEKIEIYREKNADMKEIVELLANRTINVNNEAKATAEGKIMNESTDQSRKIEITGGTVNASGAGAFSLGDISGTVANTINQLPAAPETDKPGIKEILEQLKAAIESEHELSDEDKATALEQVQVLAEAGQKPQEGAMQKTAKTAITMLKGTITVLPSTATLVEACSKLLPLITKIFGLG